MAEVNQAYKEIAYRYSVGEDKIPEILKGIKVSKGADKPTEEQLKGFEEVCKLLQSGMELNLAVQSIHGQAVKSPSTTTKEPAKAQAVATKEPAKAAAAAPAQGNGNAQAAATQPQDAALAKSNGHRQLAQLVESMPQDIREGLAALAAESGEATLSKLPEVIAQTTNNNAEQLMQGVSGFVTEAYHHHIAQGFKDPRFLERVRSAMQSGKSPRNSTQS